MLKKTIGLLLVIALIHGFACAQKAYAASADILVTHIQPGFSGGATKELIALYNNGTEAVNVTDWCLRNKANISFVCFSPARQEDQYWIPAHSFAVLASQSYADSLPVGVSVSLYYTAENTSSGGLVGTADTLSLHDETGTHLKSHTWTSALSSGALYLRSSATTDPLIYKDLGLIGDWTTGPIGKVGIATPTNQLQLRVGVLKDVCDNISGIQVEVPAGMRQEALNCLEVFPLPPPRLFITEVLPNPAGADAGKEFIELYNDSSDIIDLSKFVVGFGANAEKLVTLPDGLLIEPYEYLSLFSATLSFTLPNTAGSVKLISPTKVLIDQTPLYDTAKDDQSWAKFQDNWRYTKFPTPGTENVEPEGVITTSLAALTLKPCADNQYRSLETGRCRLLATEPASVACKENQYRSAETGRCRTVTTATTVTPCKEGQERSLETNRCRTIKSLTKTNYDVLSAKSTKGPDMGYIMIAIGAILLAIIGYAAWEWRVELKRALQRLKWSTLRR